MVPDLLHWWLLTPLGILLIVSLLDDMRGLSVHKRLIAHVVAALIATVGLGLFEWSHILHGLLAVFLILWMINLYNFMDGADGLAGGMGLFGFTTYGAAALLAQDIPFAIFNLSIAGAVLGFLFFNFNPAKVFMGDAGSIPLGFLASIIGFQGWYLGYWAAWFPILIFSPFILDASVTLVNRALRGMKITEAHREHYYQRAIQMGWGHRRLALAEYTLMACLGASALLCREQTLPWVLLLIWSVIYAGIMAVLDRNWRQFNNRVREC